MENQQMKQVKVLHTIGKFDRGGTETWLMNMLRNRPSNLNMDFLCLAKGGEYEREAIELGARCFHFPSKTNLQKKMNMVGIGKRFLPLKQLLAKERYDVVHAQCFEFCGDELKIATRARIPVRVAHGHVTHFYHNTRRPEGFFRYCRFRTINQYRVKKYATDIVGCSTGAAQLLSANQLNCDPNCSVLFCGIDLGHFKKIAQNHEAILNSLLKKYEISRDSIVIGHVGRMMPQKNHFFLLKIFRELAHRDKRYILFLAGTGERLEEIRKRVIRYGLENRVILAGMVNDIPELMATVFDVHLLPSLYEGLPIVGMEATAAGLHTVCSNSVSTDFTGTLASRVSTLPLSASPEIWADKTENCVQDRISCKEGIALMGKSPFSIQSSISNFMSLYENRLAQKELTEN